MICRILLVCLFLLGLNAAAFADDAGPTVYRIINHWQPTQAMHAADGKVAYGSGDDKTYQWALTAVKGGTHIENLATGTYMATGAGDGPLMFEPAGGLDQHALWTIDSAGGKWRSLKNQATGKFLWVENQTGLVQANCTKTPNGVDAWSGQWNVLHVGGPAPPPFIRPDMITVLSPAYCSTIKGDITVVFAAPGLSKVVAHCWKQGGAFGHDAIVATVDVGADGKGSFAFPANTFPHGPTMVRLLGQGTRKHDACYLQLYNAGGVSWNEGIPKEAPPAAKGMKLVFADDFNKPLSISGNGQGATYAAHKPGGGDFSALPFVNPGPNGPFKQIDTYLRIRGDENTNTAGLISSLRLNGTGITATAPCYFECRLTSQSAPGCWPAFWVMTKGIYKGLSTPSDELDIIEGYGGQGRHNPNQLGYWTTTHSWNQGPAGNKQPGVYQQNSMAKIGAGASWADTFHVYAVKVTKTETTYYCDNVVVAHHPTHTLSKTEPWFFLINLAIGGNGWAADLSRYGGIADMYVDYVRVYQQQGFGQQP